VPVPTKRAGWPCDPCRGWREIRCHLNLATELRSVRIAFDNAQNTTKTLRHRRGTIANSNGIKVLSANPRPAPNETEPVRTTGRNLTQDLASEYAKRVQAKAALVSTSWHNGMLALSESIIMEHAAELNARRRRLAVTSNHGQEDSRWLQEVECFIDEVIEESGGHVRSSPDRLRAVRWMIGSATAQYAASRVSFSPDSAVVADAA
jgi:hypothetical protein